MSERLHVTKMSGAGNDFIVLGPDEWARLPGEPGAWIRRICRRGLSIGADGVLCVEPHAGGARVRFWNPDASEAFCGNGTRCAARYAFHRGWTERALRLETAVGNVAAEVRGEQVRIELPAPEDRGSRTLDLGDERLAGRVVLAGVPHFVVLVDDVSAAPLERWGPRARRHPAFGTPGTNLDVVSPVQQGLARLRTWERGVEGETLSCGSGAMAAALALRLAGAPEVVHLGTASGIVLEIRLPGPPAAPSGTVMIGDARIVFEAEVDAEAVAFPDSTETR